MVIASISIPHWISYSVTTAKGETFTKHIGLHKSCSSLDDPHCRDFPYEELCQDGQRYFCSLWKTVGFLASLAAILCLATLVSFGVVMKGGKYKRETGWPLVAVLLTLVSVVEFVIISIVVSASHSHQPARRIANLNAALQAYLFDNDDQFTIPGWNLDVSWYLSTTSATISLVTAAGLAASAYLLPPEDGYVCLRDTLDA